MRAPWINNSTVNFVTPVQPAGPVKDETLEQHHQKTLWRARPNVQLFKRDAALNATIASNFLNIVIDNVEFSPAEVIIGFPAALSKKLT